MPEDLPERLSLETARFRPLGVRQVALPKGQPPPDVVSFMGFSVHPHGALVGLLHFLGTRVIVTNPRQLLAR